MDIREQKAGDAVIVALAGRLDVNTWKQTEERLMALIDDGARRLVLDLAQLDYVSSVGLRVLILAAKRVKSVNGQIVVCALKPSIQQVFDIAGFGTIFRILPTREAAVAHVAASTAPPSS